MTEPIAQIAQKKCSCNLCKLIERLNNHVLPKLDEDGKAVVDEIFSRMEAAEMDYQWNECKGKDGEPIKVGGRWYVPAVDNRNPNDTEEWNGQA
jgi:hypothetical protein